MKTLVVIAFLFFLVACGKYAEGEQVFGSIKFSEYPQSITNIPEVRFKFEVIAKGEYTIYCFINQEEIKKCEDKCIAKEKTECNVSTKAKEGSNKFEVRLKSASFDESATIGFILDTVSPETYLNFLDSFTSSSTFLASITTSEKTTIFCRYYIYGATALPDFEICGEKRLISFPSEGTYIFEAYSEDLIKNMDTTPATAVLTFADFDTDGDGYKDSKWGGDDCNDDNPNIRPGASDNICNGIDDNCNGTIDEGVIFYRDKDNDGFGTDQDTYRGCPQPQGYSYKSGDCDDNDLQINPNTQEICNNKDDNCNGQIDEGTTVFYKDEDGDGYGGSVTIMSACSGLSGYTAVPADCNDKDKNQHPKTVWRKDGDNDGFSDGVTLVQCEQPTGYTYNNIPAGDCNDDDSSMYPDAIEICDGKDNNCNGQIDDGLPPLYTFYRDQDSDGYGSTATTTSCQSSPPPSGYVSVSGDCNDSDAQINPGKSEICDGKDNNCDGQIDEGVKTTFYRDQDSDGYGSTATTTSCQSAQPPGYVSVSGDCDDNSSVTSPVAPEICDGFDNNCNGQVDDGLTKYTYYYDGDNDGYGGPTTTASCSTTPPSGYKTQGNDCNDSNPSVNPAATESCDGIDNNCNGQTDEAILCEKCVFQASGGVTGLALVDVNPNSNLEIIATTTGGKVYAVAYPSCTTVWEYPSGSTVFSINSNPAIIDINSDGSPDSIAIVNSGGFITRLNLSGSSVWTQFLNIGTGSFTFTPSASDISSALPVTKDLIIYAESGTQIAVIDGGTGNVKRTIYVGPSLFLMTEPSMSDFNTDGSMEVVVGMFYTQDEGKIVAYDVNSGSSVWTYWTPVGTNNIKARGGTALFDVNSDGIEDIFISSYGGISLFSGANGSRLWGPFESSTPVSTIPVVTNFDGGADYEVAGAGTAIYLLSVTDGSKKWKYTGLSSSSTVVGIAAADINVDGFPDVVAVTSDGKLYVISGKDGSPVYSPAATQFCESASNTSSSVVVADLDSDSKFEIIAGCPDGKLKVFSTGYAASQRDWRIFAHDARHTSRLDSNELYSPPFKFENNFSFNFNDNKPVSCSTADSFTLKGIFFIYLFILLKRRKIEL
mgnify:CR=1 FL=1